MPSNKVKTISELAAEGKWNYGVARDISDRDARDIEAVARKIREARESGKPVPTPSQLKMARMEREDALRRQGVSDPLDWRFKSDEKRLSDSDAQRKRLIDRYSQGYKKGGLVKKPAAKAAPKTAPKAAVKAAPKRLVMKKKGK